MRKLNVVLAAYALMIVGLGVYFEPARVHAQAGSPGLAWTCSLDDIGATLTKCPLLVQPEAHYALYVTDIVAQSTTTTSGNFIVRYGTGTNCGTGTTSLLPSAATAARIAAPASTAAPTMIQFLNPLRVPPGKDICVLGVATNTFTGQISGYAAP